MSKLLDKKWLHKQFAKERKQQQRADAEKYVKGALRSWFPSLCGKGEVPEIAELVGARIFAVGFHPAASEGGLALDYETPTGRKRRMVFGYTELGLWVYWVGDLKC